MLCSLIDVSSPQRLCYMLPQPPTKQIVTQTQEFSQPATSNDRMATCRSLTTGALRPLSHDRAEHGGAVQVEELTAEPYSHTSNQERTGTALQYWLCQLNVCTPSKAAIEGLFNQQLLVRISLARSCPAVKLMVTNQIRRLCFSRHSVNSEDNSVHE